MSVRLYIGNLPKEEIDRQDLQAVFAEEGDAVTTKLIKDRKTGKCRGFGFLTVNNEEQADKIIEKYNGQLFKETPIKLEKALPRTKGDEGEEQAPKIAAPVSTHAAPTPKEGGGRRDKKAKKARGTNRESSAGTAELNIAIRPDPRWATELEKLLEEMLDKERLAAQAQP